LAFIQPVVIDFLARHINASSPAKRKGETFIGLRRHQKAFIGMARVRAPLARDGP
jgi:hypothetical protein